MVRQEGLKRIDMQYPVVVRKAVVVIEKIVLLHFYFTLCRVKVCYRNLVNYITMWGVNTLCSVMRSPDSRGRDLTLDNVDTITYGIG